MNFSFSLSIILLSSTSNHKQPKKKNTNPCIIEYLTHTHTHTVIINFSYICKYMNRNRPCNDPSKRCQQKKKQNVTIAGKSTVSRRLSRKNQPFDRKTMENGFYSNAGSKLIHDQRSRGPITERPLRNHPDIR